MKEASYPALAITRQDIREAGIADQYLDLLTNSEIQTIAAQVGDVIVTNKGFKKLVFVVAWNLILQSDLSALFDTSEPTDQ